MVPNSRVLQSPARNYSLHDRYIWAHVEFWVGYEADLEAVREVALHAARCSEFYADHEPPRSWVMELGERGIHCWVAAWADTPSAAWTLKNDIRTSLACSIRKRGMRSHILRVAPDGDTQLAAASGGST